MIGIYRIISPSNKVYIGQTWDYNSRIRKYRTLHCSKQPKLYNSLKKYGYKNHVFSIIHELPIDITQDILDNYECLYINQYKECGIELLNLREGGNSRGKHSDESKKRMSIYHKTIGKERADKFVEYSKSPEVRKIVAEKVREYYKNNISPNSIKVYQFDLYGSPIRTWDSIREISRQLDCNSGNISRAIKLNRKYKDFIWKT